MLKKTSACLFALALVLGFGNSLYAQEEGWQFTIPTPSVSVIEVTEDTKMDLLNVADLTPEELKAALEQSTCQGGPTDSKNPGVCAAFSGPNCTGVQVSIPCGSAANAATFGFARWGSIGTGCTRTFASPCTFPWAPGCQVFVFNTPKLCATPPAATVIQSVACSTP